MTIGEQIKTRRKERKVTIKKLASEIGRSIEYVSYIERDEREPREFERKNIEKFLKFKIVDPDEYTSNKQRGKKNNSK